MTKATTTTKGAKAAKTTTAAELAARELTPAQLVERLTQTQVAEERATAQVEHFRSMWEAAQAEKSSHRVLLARAAYLLATHAEVQTKQYPVFIGGAAKVIAGPGADTKEIDRLRKWVTVHVKAGEALAAKGIVFQTADPTEAERAIVEEVHDVLIREESAKKNARRAAREAKATEAAKAAEDKAAAEAAKAAEAEETETETETETVATAKVETLDAQLAAGLITPAEHAAEVAEVEVDADGVEKSKVETYIPTAEGIIGALETVRKNMAKFNTEARFTAGQIAAIEDLLVGITAELAPELAEA